MNRLDRLLQTANAIKKDSLERIFLKNLEYTGTDKVVNAPYKNSTLAYTCISTTATAIAQVPLVVQTRKKKKGKDIWEDASGDDDWHRLLTRPNYLTSYYTFIEAIVGYLLLDGNVWVFGFPPGVNPPDSFWVIQKANMKAFKDGNTGHLLAWEYRAKAGSEPTLIKPNEVAHIKFWNPNDPIFGQKPLEAGALPLVSDYKAAKYNETFFDEGAAPGGVLSTDKNLSDTQFARVQAQFEERHKGYKRAHRVAVLEGGLKYTPMGLSQKDMEFIDLRRYSRDEILQVFGMKKAVLSITDDLNYATHKGQVKAWWHDTNIPIMHLIESAFNFTFFEGGLKRRVKYDLSTVEALQEEYDTKVKSAHALWNMGYPANKLNQKLGLGLDEISGGDIGYVPMNYYPIGGGTPIPSTPNAPKLIEGEVVEEKEEDRHIVNVEDLRERRLEAIWKSFIAKTIPLEDKFEKKTKRVFFEMRKRVLQKLYEEEKSRKQDDAVVPYGFFDWLRDYEFPNEKELIKKYSAPFYTEAVKVGGQSFIDEMGLDIDFDLSDPLVVDFLKLKPLKITGVIDPTIRNQLRDTCREGVQAGEGIDDIAKRIKAIFNIAANRARTIARTEVVGSSNFGRHVALDSSGFKWKEWFTAMDERVRDQHKQMMHPPYNRVRVGEPWTFPDGNQVDYPGDWNGVAWQVVNCRCIEVVAR